MRKKELKIGIVGCGAIGTSLARFVARSLKGRAVLASVYDLERARAEKIASSLRLPKRSVAGSLDALIASSALVIECAHARAAAEICRRALLRGRSVMVMSVGGIAASFPALKKTAASAGARIYIPSGALAGIDALKSLRIAGLRRVTLITRKHPRSLEGNGYIAKKGIRLDRIRKERVIFSGTAREAVRHFPRNINVAALASLAGMGTARTMVTIIASPSIKRNIHELCAESPAGTLRARMANVLHPANPKTSYLAVLSASSMLQNIVEPATIGS